MNFADYVILFISSYFVVMLLGLQSKHVNNSRYFAAVVTSFFISASQYMFVKYVATGNSWTFWVAAVGGCCGIASAIWIYDNVFPKMFNKKAKYEKS